MLKPAMLAWAILQHAAWEGPGLIADGLEARGWDYDIYRLDQGATLPTSGSFAGLVVMGGPMGVYEAARHPYLDQERDLLAGSAADGLPVLGVCLGAQLLAAALGAEVSRGPVAEIGAGHVRLTADGEADPVLGGAGSSFPVVHWHQDTFTLPPGALQLASSDLYPQQAFRAGRLAYGLQFHCELNLALAALWQPHLPAGHALTPNQIAAVGENGRQIFARFLDLAQSESLSL